MKTERYAEDINYWKSGKSSPDTWLDKAEAQIVKSGGTILGRAFGSDSMAGVETYMLAFQIADDQFKIVWPVLQSRTDNKQAARRQAATMIYHDIKAKCMVAEIFGMKKAFVSYLVLSDGSTVTEAATDALPLLLPKLLSQSIAVE